MSNMQRFSVGSEEHSAAAVQQGQRVQLTLDGTTREFEVFRVEGDAVVLRSGTDQLRVRSVQDAQGIWVFLGAQRMRVALPQARARRATAQTRDVVEAPMTGKVISVAQVEGASVSAGDLLVVLEAMKMEHRLLAPCSGTVTKVQTTAGAIVDIGAVLVRLRPETPNS